MQNNSDDRVRSRKFTLVYFICSIVLIVFFIGVFVGMYRFFPYSIIRHGWSGILDWKKNYKQYLKISPLKHIGEPRKHYPRTFFKKDGAWPGVTLVTTFINDGENSGPGLVLLDFDGNVIHKWFVPVSQVFPKSKRDDWEVIILGAALLENGDVIFNFSDVGMVKLDWCSNVIWRLPIFSHHNIFIDENQNIWTGVKKHSEKRTLHTQYPKTLTIYFPDAVVEISPDGKILRDIDVLDLLLKSDLKGILFANGQQRLSFNDRTDSYLLTHLNDVEVLGTNNEEKFPLFDAGDIMISLRNLNLLMVLDGKTNLPKWWMVGPFLRQHDPDFDRNGRISVLDNMGGGPETDIGYASRILSIDPLTMDVNIAYSASPPEDFYTYERGSHQLLPNGNLLITETFEGRIFEVNAKGEVVWQYITKWDDKLVIKPYQAERYAADYSAHDELKCTESSTGN